MVLPCTVVLSPDLSLKIISFSNNCLSIKNINKCFIKWVKNNNRFVLIPTCIPRGGKRKMTSLSTLEWNGFLGVNHHCSWTDGSCKSQPAFYFNWPFQDSNSRKKENHKAKYGALSAHYPSQVASEAAALVLSLAAVWKLLPGVLKLAVWTVTKCMQEWKSPKDHNIVTRTQHFTTPFVFLAICKRKSCAKEVRFEASRFERLMNQWCLILT